MRYNNLKIIFGFVMPFILFLVSFMYGLYSAFNKNYFGYGIMILCLFINFDSMRSIIKREL